MEREIRSDYPKICACGTQIYPGTRYFSEQEGLYENVTCLACHEAWLEAQANDSVAANERGWNAK